MEYAHPKIEQNCGDFRVVAGSLDGGPWVNPRESRVELFGADGQLLWELIEMEKSIHDLFLADDGWVIIRGGDFVFVVPPGSGEFPTYHNMKSFIESSTRLYAFFTHQGDRYFSLLSIWGERWLVNLTGGELSPQASLEAAIREEQLVETILSGDAIESYPYWGAIVFVHRRRTARLIPLLLAHWRAKKSVRSTWSCCVGIKIACYPEEPLPLLALVLASLGVLEGGAPCYTVDLNAYGYSSAPMPPVSQDIPDRSERLARLCPGMDASRVLDEVGMADYMTEEQNGPEMIPIWDYYSQSPLRVTRIHWNPLPAADIWLVDHIPFTPAEVEARLRELAEI